MKDAGGRTIGAGSYLDPESAAGPLSPWLLPARDTERLWHRRTAPGPAMGVAWRDNRAHVALFSCHAFFILKTDGGEKHDH